MKHADRRTLRRPAEEEGRGGRRIAGAWRQWCVTHPRMMLAILTVVALAPFLAKPFNMDDPLFVWSARQIQSYPTDPYGFSVNWYGSAMPMWEVTKNPPFTCYYLAAAAAVFGWNEAALHLAMLLPAVAAILGTWRLAKRLCSHPSLAAAVTLFTPVVLVSSTSVMCDTTLLAFWTWAVALWIEGIEGNHHRQLAGAAVLTALAVMTKYFGICLLPLLVAHGFLRTRRLGPWVLWMIVPLATIGMYQLGTSIRYGHGLFSDASTYAATIRDAAGLTMARNAWTGLSFMGACLLATVYLPVFWRSRLVLSLVALVLLGGIVMFANRSLLNSYPYLPAGSHWFVGFQVILWAIGGAAILGMTVSDLYPRRNADSWLLFLWIVGTFLFAAFFNWTQNARSLMPMAPAAGILIVRALERSTVSATGVSRRIYVSMTVAAVMTFTVAWADFSVARAVGRTVDDTIAGVPSTAGTIWFQGHWGFQYYMQLRHAQPLDQNGGAQKGDVIAVPLDNSNFFPMDTNSVVLVTQISAARADWVATMCSEAGAGFYSSLFGPLPFTLGPAPPETVAIFGVTKTFSKP